MTKTKYAYFVSFTQFASRKSKFPMYNNNEFTVNDKIENLNHIRMMEQYMVNAGVIKPKIVSFQLLRTFEVEVEDEVPTQSSETLNTGDTVEDE